MHPALLVVLLLGGQVPAAPWRDSGPLPAAPAESELTRLERWAAPTAALPDDDTLKRHVNRRVQVDGNFKSLDGGMKGDALIEIQATGIRPVSGDCPPK